MPKAEVYVVGYDWRRTAVIDVFISLVWTERYNDSPDFVLVVSATATNKAVLVEGAFLQIPQSQETMQIESVSIKNGQLTVTGQSVTNILKNRIYRTTWQNTQDSVSITGTAAYIIGSVVNAAVGSGGGPIGSDLALPVGYGANEIIPSFEFSGTPSGPIYTVAVPFGPAYDAIQPVAKTDDLGFGLRINMTQPTFYMWRGRDLTSSQNVYPPVIFESSAENISELEELRSIAGYVTHAYAWASGMTAQSSIGVAVAPGASALTGWQRRSLMVDASDINATDYTASALKTMLNQRAADALANNNYVRMLDGKIVPQTRYRYGYEYLLGDVLELRGSGTTSQKARVTEYIRTQDSTGWHEYPTLQVVA